jgi:GTP-binding protein
VVRVGDVDFVLADIPGLIEGAHEGAGLGTRFLGHVERCAVLLHLVDATQDDVAEAYKTVRREIRAYSPELAKRKELVALSKCDAVLAEDLEKKSAELTKTARKKPMMLSAVSGLGMKDALFAIVREIARQKDKSESMALESEGRPRWLP